MVRNVGYQLPFVDGTGFLFGVGDRPRTVGLQLNPHSNLDCRVFLM